jgi:hypothetical protein
MTKGKSTEAALNGLHGVVATVLTEQLELKEKPTSFDEDGNMVEGAEEVYTASPALLATAIKFLKDNQITADIKTDTNMGKLQATLNSKQKHSRLTNAKQSALRIVEES